MKTEKIYELKNLLIGSELFDLADNIESVVKEGLSSPETLEIVEYLQHTRKDAEVARDSILKRDGNKSDDYLRYRLKAENLLKALEIIYLFA